MVSWMYTLTLFSCSDSPDRDEDWIFVVKVSNPQQRGFVPAGKW